MPPYVMPIGRPSFFRVRQHAYLGQAWQQMFSHVMDAHVPEASTETGELFRRKLLTAQEDDTVLGEEIQDSLDLGYIDACRTHRHLLIRPQHSPRRQGVSPVNAH